MSEGAEITSADANQIDTSPIVSALNPGTQRHAEHKLFVQVWVRFLCGFLRLIHI
jgi:hypothetical protein